jgi:hypothetical protein
MRRLLDLLRRQDGVAMPTVMGALAVTTLLAGTTFAVSLEGQHSSTRDRDSKRALAAAEAGLQMGFLKLSEVRPTSDAYCVTDAAVLPGTNGAAAGECPWHEGDLGNGARYRYVVATPTSGTCPAVPGKPTSVRDRCITSIGTVNGVKRRLQMRILYIPPWKPFREAGLVARNNIDIRHNETQVNSTVGANGNVTITNGTRVNGGVILGESTSTATFTNGGGTVNNQPPSRRDSPFEFPNVDALFDAASKPAGNQNATLSSTYFSSGQRAFAMGNSTSYTINGGTYHFCSFTMNQGAKLRVPAGQVVRIFLDSARRPGSPCTNQAHGEWLQGQATEVNREFGADPAQLELYVYGRNGDSLDDPGIEIGNAAYFYGSIYAPYASLSLPNSGTLIGAATVNNASIVNNSEFTWDNRVLNKTIPGTGEADTRSWFECRRDPTVESDPESGCST